MQYTDSKFANIQRGADCNVPSLQFLLALKSQYHDVRTGTAACGCGLEGEGWFLPRYHRVTRSNPTES